MKGNVQNNYHNATKADKLVSSEQFLAWAWLVKAKGHSCLSKNELLPKPFTKKKTNKSANNDRKQPIFYSLFTTCYIYKYFIGDLHRGPWRRGSHGGLPILRM